MFAQGAWTWDDEDGAISGAGATSVPIETAWISLGEDDNLYMARSLSAITRTAAIKDRGRYSMRAYVRSDDEDDEPEFPYLGYLQKVPRTSFTVSIKELFSGCAWYGASIVAVETAAAAAETAAAVALGGSEVLLVVRISLASSREHCLQYTRMSGFSLAGGVQNRNCRGRRHASPRLVSSEFEWPSELLIDRGKGCLQVPGNFVARRARQTVLTGARLPSPAQTHVSRCVSSSLYGA